MGWGNWMALNNSLERQAQIEIHRREIRAMPEDQLRAIADHLLVQGHTQGALLRSAMRRIAELEVQSALFDAAKEAASLQPRQPKLRAVLSRLLHWRRQHRGRLATQHPPQAHQGPADR